MTRRKRCPGSKRWHSCWISPLPSFSLKVDLIQQDTRYCNNERYHLLRWPSDVTEMRWGCVGGIRFSAESRLRPKSTPNGSQRAKSTFLSLAKVTCSINCNAKICCIQLVCTYRNRNVSLCCMKQYEVKIRFSLNWRSGNRLSCDRTLNNSPPTFSKPAQL